MLIFFIIFFEMAILYFAGSILLNIEVPLPQLGYLAFFLMVAGALLVEWKVFGGEADVMFTSYVPLRAHPIYYLGIILFAVGALIVCALFFASLISAKRKKTYEGSMPLVTFGGLTAAIIAVITLVHGAIIYIPTFLWSLGVIPKLDAELYRLLFWGLGHPSQQINVSAHVAVWYLMMGLTVGAVVPSEKVSRIAFTLYILFISMASAHHLLVDPGFSPAWKVINTSYFMYMAVFASMIHGFTIPASVELGQRLRGYTRGIFEWLAKAPWGDPGFSATALSVVIFGFIGGITGVTIGTEQISIIAHNTLRIPGHFHATVVGGTALAFMGLTYYVIPLIFRRRIVGYSLAKIQPYLFGIGITILSISMTFAGTFGVPRRHWDISFSQAPFSFSFPPVVDLFMAGVGIGGILAFLGALLYILVTVGSVFFGEKVDLQNLNGNTKGLPPSVVKLPPQIHRGEKVEEVERQGTPGTLVLVFIFLLAFVLYYFNNWQLLSRVWKIG
jgi:cytochrome c oxidase subunit 1